MSARILTLFATVGVVILLTIGTLQAEEVGKKTAPLTGAGVVNDVNTPERNAVVRTGGGCTGTLIRHDIVLTAGHCVDHGHPGTITDASGRRIYPAIIRDEYVNDWETPGQWYPLYKFPRGIRISFGPDSRAPVFTATAVQYSIPAHADMIALRLDRSIPARVAIPKRVLPNSPMHSPSWRSERFRIAGWGGGARIRRTGPASNGVWPCNTSFGMQPHKMCVTGSVVQGGDSGGPLFWKNPNDRDREYLIGVTQGVEPNGGRFTVTFYSGGMMGSTPIPNIGRWLANLTGVSPSTGTQKIYMVPSRTEKRFANPMQDGYRLDWCLHWGRECGRPAANAWCVRKGYSYARSQIIARDIGARTPTRVMGDRKTCSDADCDGFAEIVCYKE